jgi:hypothetical protein
MVYYVLLAGVVGIIIGVVIGYMRMERLISSKTRKMVIASRHCYMCEDCPDGCPLDKPEDSRNDQ